MKTNITIDNYEAYLLDYVEGNLSPEGAAELKAFVAAQGLDWDELTEELPHLEVPQIVYENKADLKQRPLSLSKGRPQRTIVPLYVKITSAAAAAGLLLTVTLWPEKPMPKVEPIVNLKPIEVGCIDTKEPLALLPRRASESRDSMPHAYPRRDDRLSKTSSKGHTISERESATLLDELPTRTVTALQSALPLSDFDDPDFDFLTWRMNADLAYTPYDTNDFSDEVENERNLSLISRGLLWATNGRHDSFASLIGAGVHKAKQELTEAATDVALTAYYRADEHFEEVKEHWEEKRGE